MPILVCEKCNTYFEIHSKGELVELGNCECGTKYKYFESLEDYHNKEESIIEEEDEFFSQLMNSHESSIARIIIYSINELPFPLGINKLISFLRGSKASFIVKNNLNKLNSYSILSYFSKKRLTRYIKTLEKRGILKSEPVTEFKRPALFITSDGMDFLSTDKNLSFRIYGNKFNKIMGDVDGNEIITNENISYNDDKYENSYNGSFKDNISLLLNDKDGKKRAHCAFLIGESRNTKYVDVLCKAIYDVDGNVRRMVASALGKLGDKRAEGSLILLLNDPKPQVRQYAAKALGNVGTYKSFEYLQKLLDDEKEYNSKAAEIAIYKINNRLN